MKPSEYAAQLDRKLKAIDKKIAALKLRRSRIRKRPTKADLEGGHVHTEGTVSIWSENGQFHVARTVKGGEENAEWESFLEIRPAWRAFGDMMVDYLLEQEKKP